MSWVRLDDQMAFHAKIVAAGNEAVGAWVRILALTCAQLSDGRVTQAVALTIAKQKVLEVLVKVRLLDRTEDGYVVHDFHDWNPPAADVKAKREAERKRKEDARKGQSRGSDGRMRSASCPSGQPPPVRAESENCPPVPSSSSPLPSFSEGEEIPGREPARSEESSSETRLRTATASRDPMGDHEIADAWAAGVAEGSGSSMSTPRGGALQAILAVAESHGPKRAGMNGSRDVAAWVRARAKAYGAAARGQTRNAFRFCDFVNSPDAPIGSTAKARPEPTTPQYERFENRKRTEPIGEPPPSPAKAGAR